MDPDTMTPAINSAQGVAALDNFRDVVAAGVPGMLQWEWGGAHTCFMTGQCASIVHWPDEGLMTALFKANTGSEMGFAPVPGNANMTCGGWVAGITKDSKNPEAAFMVLDYILGPDVSTLIALYPGGGTDLFRQSHFESQIVKLIAPQDYLDAHNEAAGMIIGELRIPGGFEYYDSLDIGVQKAIAGETSSQEALDAVAKNWEKITDRLGRDNQKKMYAAAMGL
jgi:multiple sugar transport system substrate-binding protein